MPTASELGYLVSKCDWTWTTRNGVNGYIVRGKGSYASASIFLPCSGYGYGTSLKSAGSYGSYWSSEPLEGTSYDAIFDSYSLVFASGSGSPGTIYHKPRKEGYSVRPVQSP